MTTHFNVDRRQFWLKLYNIARYYYRTGWPALNCDVNEKVSRKKDFSTIVAFLVSGKDTLTGNSLRQQQSSIHLNFKL